MEKVNNDLDNDLDNEQDDDIDDDIYEQDDDDIDKRDSLNKIYCANCYHCVLLRAPANGKDGQYFLRVKCNKGKWRKKLGDEKLYKYFSVGRRTIDECEEYIEMGELKQFLKDLRKSLPVKDELYEIK